MELPKWSKINEFSKVSIKIKNSQTFLEAQEAASQSKEIN